MFWARLTLWSVLGLALDSLGQDYRSTGFWCVVGLFFALDTINRIETHEFLEELEQEIRKRRGKHGNP